MNQKSKTVAFTFEAWFSDPYNSGEYEFAGHRWFDIPEIYGIDNGKCRYYKTSEKAKREARTFARRSLEYLREQANNPEIKVRVVRITREIMK